MRALALALSFAAVAFMAGCTKPTEVLIPSDMSKWDEELAPAVKKLSEEDRKAVAAYLARVKVGEVFGGGGVPMGTTVGDAIAQQKEWVTAQEKKAAEAKALKEKMEQERTALIGQIEKAVTVTLLSKQQRHSNYQVGRYSDEQVFVIGVQNNGEKDLVGVSGTIQFIDVFDNEVGSVSFGIDERIKPGASHRWTGSRDYNQFIKEHKAVWNLEEGKYTTRFMPKQLIFADGTKLEMPQG